MIEFNNKVKLILSDVDETVADVYRPAKPEMIKELVKLLREGKIIFFISGTSLEWIQKRIVSLIPPELRKNVLASHCSGAEVWGYDKNGELHKNPYYSLYDEKLSEEQKLKWRSVVDKLIREFELETYSACPVDEFRNIYGDNPKAIMLDDRGPQITLEFVNAYDMNDEQLAAFDIEIPQTHGQYDLREPVFKRVEQLLVESNLPVTPRLGGEFALDLALEGVSKTESITHLLENKHVTDALGLDRDDLDNPEHIEIWGDKFDARKGGTDRHMCEAVDKRVRAIDFRQEDPEGFLEGYNVVLWDGEQHLHDGLLEFLKSRQAN